MCVRERERECVCGKQPANYDGLTCVFEGSTCFTDVF